MMQGTSERDALGVTNLVPPQLTSLVLGGAGAGASGARFVHAPARPPGEMGSQRGPLLPRRAPHGAPGRAVPTAAGRAPAPGGAGGAGGSGWLRGGGGAPVDAWRAALRGIGIGAGIGGAGGGMVRRPCPECGSAGERVPPQRARLRRRPAAATARTRARARALHPLPGGSPAPPLTRPPPRPARRRPQFCGPAKADLLRLWPFPGRRKKGARPPPRARAGRFAGGSRRAAARRGPRASRLGRPSPEAPSLALNHTPHPPPQPARTARRRSSS
jgi:hypothetical protein